MEATYVNVKRAGGGTGPGAATGVLGVAELEADLARARALAKALDAQFEIGGIKFGLDSIIGLVPVVGDTITSMIALYPIWIAKRHNLGKTVVARMSFNVFVDWAGGLIPVAGDVIDLAYKANLKNLKLLERAAERRRRK